MHQPDLLTCGDVIIIALPAHIPRGRGQKGTRPAVVVGVPEGEIRYPMVVIAPLTIQTGSWSNNNLSLYPRLEAGTGGLLQPSIVLLDQIRGIDASRVLSYLGTLISEQYAVIFAGLMQLFRQKGG